MKQTLWNKYFNFSRTERVGIVVLLILIGICCYANVTWDAHNIPDARDTALFTFRETPVVKPAPQIAAKLFNFDPNTLAEENWKKLGVSPVTIKTIQHYLAKGGQFRKKEDLQRIYGLSSAMYARLAPYVQIEEQQVVTYTWPEKKQRVIDVNTADSAAWESLSGVGPVLAARIVKFRTKLGGFYAIRQIRETYGLPDSTFVKIEPSLRLNAVSLKNLDINQLDEQSLAEHPYIRHKLARLIVLYRSNNGPFTEPADLLGIPLVDDSIYRKLEPYIKTIK